MAAKKELPTKKINQKTNQKAETNQKANAARIASSDVETDPGTNGFATASLILGITFFVPFAPILAIIFGFIGLYKIKETGERGKGMAIAGIILGFFWIILFIILCILFMVALLVLLGSSTTG